MGTAAPYFPVTTMRYLIDGYNLAHALGVLRGKIAPAGIEVARRSLLIRLLEAPGLDPTKVIVVFDAQRAPPGTAARMDFQGICILNALRRQADDLIEDLIESETQPKQLAIVSDDRRLKDAARRRRCVPLGCLDFFEKIQQPRQAAQPRAALEREEKPEVLSAEDRLLWYREFGVGDDPDTEDF